MNFSLKLQLYIAYSGNAGEVQVDVQLVANLNIDVQTRTSNEFHFFSLQQPSDYCFIFFIIRLESLHPWQIFPNRNNHVAAEIFAANLAKNV